MNQVLEQHLCPVSEAFEKRTKNLKSFPQGSTLSTSEDGKVNHVFHQSIGLAKTGAALKQCYFTDFKRGFHRLCAASDVEWLQKYFTKETTNSDDESSC